MGSVPAEERENLSMGLAASKASNVAAQNGELFYGVHIPKCSEDDFLHVYEDKVEALKVVKHHKKARFKAFKLRTDAVAFAVHGSESTSCIPEIGGNDVVTVTLSDAEKPGPFKGPKPQDMVEFRNTINNGNLQLVRKTIWDNPRYLVSSGDTPSILQEGCRYNALHIAAKSKNAAMVDLILQTVGDPAFIKLLYGEDSSYTSPFGTAAERAAVLLDLYLNTPDKGINETPLHFASKFGAVQVVATLVSYPQCDREAINKLGHRPIDVVCTRNSAASEDVKSEIVRLLQNDYYVPVLRAEDNSLPPIVGSPFSPKDPPILNEDPISPRVEIHAFAGPMSQSQANEFHRQWRTPQRVPKAPADGSRSCPTIFRLQDPHKGLERFGRELAANHSVAWKEYWPFLDTFIDLSSPEGLTLLEEYLARRFENEHNNSGIKINYAHQISNETKDSEEVLKVHNSADASDVLYEPEILSPVTNLCSLMKACTLLDDSVGSGQGRGSPFSTSSSASTSSNGSVVSSSSRFFDWLSRKRPEKEKATSDEGQNDAMASLSHPTLSPFLHVEKSLQLFAKRIAASLHHLVSGSTSNHLSDSIRDVLKPEVKKVQSLVSSYMEDARFATVDYHLVHSRIASSVAERLVGQLTWEEREVFYSSLQDMLAAKGHFDTTLSSDEDDSMPSNTPFRQSRTVRQSNCSNHKTAIRCIVSQMVWALDQLQGSGPDGRSPLPPRPLVRTENECLEMWSDAYPCLCPWPAHSQANFPRGSRKSSSMKRSINSPSSLDSSNVSRRLDYEDKDDQATERMKRPSQSKAEAHPLDEDGDDLFFTPPSSPRESPVPPPDSDSDSEEMHMPEEGPAVFIEGNEPSRVDADVMNAVARCNITQMSHPHIYRWRHEILLHPLEERKRWPIRVRSDALMNSLLLGPPNHVSTPVSCHRAETSSSSPWSRITGPYSPLSSKGFKKGS